MTATNWEQTERPATNNNNKRSQSTLNGSPTQHKQSIISISPQHQSRHQFSGMCGIIPMSNNRHGWEMGFSLISSSTGSKDETGFPISQYPMHTQNTANQNCWSHDRPTQTIKQSYDGTWQWSTETALENIWLNTRTTYQHPNNQNPDVSTHKMYHYLDYNKSLIIIYSASFVMLIPCLWCL